MSMPTHLRRWGPALVLAATSFGSWREAQQRDIDDVSVEPVTYELELTTPMLSARRIPRTLQAPVVDDLIRPSIDGFITQSPETSCLIVRSGDRIVEPQANPDLPLLPASNQKLLTTYGAFVALGGDFRFHTRVTADADPVDGVINGNLYFIGDGDPFLTTDNWWTQYDEVDGRFHTRLEDLADRIVDAGVTSVTGAVLGDESLFDSARQGPWAERLIEQKQSGPLSALTVNEGYVDWPPDGASSRARSETDNPPLHAASVLAQLLQERGVGIGGTGVGIAPTDASVIAEIESPPLNDIVTHINSYSSNIGAELLLKRVGVVRAAEGSTRAGADAILSILREDGIPTEGLVIDDGSGLAETDRLTCRSLAAVLAAAGSDSPFAASLAIGGERGSLENRLVDTEAEGQVLAKTGTLNDATALSGFVRSNTDPDVTLIFAYVANQPRVIHDDEVRGLQDPFVVSLSNYPGEPSATELSPLSPTPQ